MVGMCQMLEEIYKKLITHHTNLITSVNKKTLQRAFED